MPRYNNYFDEAIMICRDSDLDVRSIAETLYQRMLAESINNKLLPCPGFNMFYFIQSAVRLWISQQTEKQWDDAAYKHHAKSVKGVNWPVSGEALHEQNSMALRFVELVRTESTPSGDEFDMEYAVKILKLTFDDAGNLLDPVRFTIEDEADFDNWLSGFNAENVSYSEE